jgi:hypothetical protein
VLKETEQAIKSVKANETSFLLMDLSVSDYEKMVKGRGRGSGNPTVSYRKLLSGQGTTVVVQLEATKLTDHLEC